MNEIIKSAELQTQAKRRFKNFLIDRNFQLGWVFKVALVTTIIVGIMGYFLNRTLRESTELIVTEALVADGISPEAQQAIIEQGEKDKLFTRLILISGLLGMVVMLSFLTIVATHKIAGPAYKMRKLFSSVNGDNYQLWAKLRKGDELHDVFQSFDEMMRRIREGRHQDVEELASIRDKLEEMGNTKETEAILSIENRFKASVKMN